MLVVRYFSVIENSGAYFHPWKNGHSTWPGWYDAGMIEKLRLGARYSTFKALEAAVEKFSRETNSVYIVNHSRSAELENKIRPQNKQIPKCLKYKNIKFACKHYGKTRTNSRGLRPNQSSFKIGCPSYIYASADKKELVVQKLETHHSHSCDPELVSLYPERRSLANSRCADSEDGTETGFSLKSVREDVLDLLAAGVERRRILNYAWTCTGRKLLSGDLANLAKTLKTDPREVSEERSAALLEHLEAMEGKQNGNTYKPVTRSGGLRTMKRKVPFPSETVIKAEVVSNEEDSSEQCYSVMETDHGEQGYSNTVYISDPMQLMSHENIQGDDIQYHYEAQEESTDTGGQENTATAWSENSSLADVVKSILGPNQEGPVILHVNNYDGVAVVQVADPQTYSAAELQEQDSQENNQSIVNTVESAQTGSESQPVTRLIVKKSQAPKKPVVVPAMQTESKKGVSAHESILRAAQLKKQTIPSVSHKSSKMERNEGRLSEDESLHDDYSDTQSDSRSVLEEERTMYQVKTKKIKLQIDSLKNSIERQELEKKKLHLELKLLKMQVEEKEVQAQQQKNITEKKK